MCCRYYLAPDPDLVEAINRSALADLLAYLSFRRMIVLEDNVQLAMSGGRLISFDYAESFYLTEQTYGGMLYSNDCSWPLHLFTNNLRIEGALSSDLEVLRWPVTKFLEDAYLAPAFAFLDADLQPILTELAEAFPPIVPEFFRRCFDELERELTK